MSKAAQLLFHGVAAAMYLCALVRYEFLPLMPHRRSHEHFAGRFKYLTYWNLIMQFLYFAFSCYVDSKGLTSRSFIRFRDKLYAGIAMPYGLFVFAMFWILYGIDRELIFPRNLDAVFPPWLNHVSHTVIVPVLLVETWVLRHRHPHRAEGFLLALLVGAAYVSWTLYLALGMDIWVYPVLQMMDWTQRGIFFALSVLLLYLVYVCGERVNCLCWGRNIVDKNR